jgi:hypothetical protein
VVLPNAAGDVAARWQWLMNNAPLDFNIIQNYLFRV